MNLFYSPTVSANDRKFKRLFATCCLLNALSAASVAIPVAIAWGIFT